MSSSKTPAEDQMGSRESDDEFSNANDGNLSKRNDAGKGSSRKVNSPKRTKVKYDYKFDSSSDNDSDETSARKNSKSGKVKSSDSNNRNGKTRESKLPAKTSKVVEKINEELKNIKNGNDKAKKDSVGTPAAGTPKIPPPSTACVQSPVVVVPQPIFVSQTHSVMAMAPPGMIVPPAIGLTNQNVMIPPPNLLNLPGNVIRAPGAVGGIMAAAPGGAVMSMGNPNMINPMQNQGSVLGMPNDILQLQGNIMGLAAPPNMMPMPGICVAGNMIPVQGAMPGNIMRIPGTNAAVANPAILNNQAGIMTNTSTMMAPGGVMLNTGNVMTVANVMGNQGNMMGNPENLMMGMNNLGARMNYPGNVMGAQGMCNVGNVNPSNEVKMQDSQTQICTNEWRNKTKPQRKAKILRRKKKTMKKWRLNRKMKGEDDGGEEGKDEDDDEDDEEGKDKERDAEGEGEEEEEEGDDEDDEEEAEGDEDATKPVVKETANTFKNDGSFMEMFKKMNEANNSKASSNKNEMSPAEKKQSETSNFKRPSVLISGIVGKRRGGRVLKTGLVKKVKKDNESEEEKGPKDAWAVYMAEVKKYREASCEEEGKTRPLVK